MKFTVQYSKKLDSEIYINWIWNKKFYNYGTDRIDSAKKFLPSEFVDKLASAKNKKEAEEIVLSYFKYKFNDSFYFSNEILSKWFEKFLNEEQDLIIKPLEKIYNEKFPFEKINVYLTSFFACPYSYEDLFFMVSKNSSLIYLLTTAKHELNHFMFYFYFQDYLEKKKISNEKIECLKEALAVLSNLGGNENADKPDVLEIQNFIKENRDKSVKEIIDLTIEKGLLN